MNTMEYYSPAMSVNSDMTDEELDKYFATYIPLSNLPTPPPAKESHMNTTRTTTSSQTQTSPSSEIQGMFLLLVPCIPSLRPGLKCWKLLARDPRAAAFPLHILVPRHSLLNIMDLIHFACCSWRSGRHITSLGP
jgi:hypothetical protein